MQPPIVVETQSQMRRIVVDLQRSGQTVGLAPTMGALHRGHLSLVEAARRMCDATVVTIFVNPTQFAPGEDFERYPRTFDADLQLLAALGVDYVFAPSVDEMYPSGATTRVEVGGVALPLEGEFRPGHFSGVATIVLKLFMAAPADVAFFGQKDYQQTLVVRRMVVDLGAPTRIEVCPIVRDDDGLALSSRNAYLSPDERRRALGLSRSLKQAETMTADGQLQIAPILQAMHAVLADAGIDQIDYVAIVDPETLQPLDQIDRPALAALAVHVGAARLIDNSLLLEPKSRP